MKIFTAACVDLLCAECGKFMGQHVFKSDLPNYKKKAMNVIEFLNKNGCMPMCDTCTTTLGFTLAGTKSAQKEKKK